MTETPREELTVDRLHRALVARTGGRLDKATGDQLAEALAEAGLENASPGVVDEALNFVVLRWKQQCRDQTLRDLALWQPTDAELVRPH